MVISNSDMSACHCLQTAPTSLSKVTTTTALNANLVTSSMIIMVASWDVRLNTLKRMVLKSVSVLVALVTLQETALNVVHLVTVTSTHSTVQQVLLSSVVIPIITLL